VISDKGQLYWTLDSSEHDAGGHFSELDFPTNFVGILGGGGIGGKPVRKIEKQLNKDNASSRMQLR